MAEIRDDIIELINSTINESTVLTDYIKAFWDNIEDEATVKSIGYRIGLFVYNDKDRLAYEVFIDSLLSYLELYPYHMGKIRVDDIINLSYDKFIELMDQHNIQADLDIKYQNRLISVATLYV